MLRDLPDQGLAVGVGHPVLGLDLVVGIHLGLEAVLEASRVAGGGVHALLP